MNPRRLQEKSAGLQLVVTLLATLAVGSGAPAFAQGGGQEQHGAEVSKIVRLNRAPVSHEILKVHLPESAVKKLPNGLTVLLLEQHKLPTVAFALWIKTGALSDPKDMPGLAGFTAEMLKEGTTHRSSEQLATDVDSIGASLDATAAFGSNLTQVSASGLASSSDRLLELMSDMVVNATYPADELAKYQKRQLADLEEARSEPDFLADERFHKALYRDFPASVSTTTPEAINAASSARLKEFHDRTYAPSNAILGVVGDFKTDEMLALIAKHFGAWPDHAVDAPKLGELPPPEAKTIYLVDRPGSVQTNIVLGDYGARRVDPDYVPLVVMNRVLGDGPSARLFINLREEHGYTYGAYSQVGDDIYREPWQANTEVRTPVTDGSMHELMFELNRIRDQKVPDQELEEARNSIVARFALSLESPGRLLFYSMLVNYYGLPADYWNQYPAEVAEVSADTVEAAAKKYIDLDHLQVVCVGDSKQIKDVLKKYGPVEVYDSNGKRLE
jgi:zinc protease